MIVVVAAYVLGLVFPNLAYALTNMPFFTVAKFEGDSLGLGLAQRHWLPYRGMLLDNIIVVYDVAGPYRNLLASVSWRVAGQYCCMSLLDHMVEY